MKKLLAVLALASIPALSGCEASSVLTEEQLAQVELIDMNIDTLEQEAAILESRAVAAMKEVVALGKTGDVDAMELAAASYNRIFDTWSDVVAEIAVQAGSQQAIFDEALAGKVGGYSGMVGSIVGAIYPPAAPFAGLLDLLTIPLAGMFFKKPRRAVLNSLKYVAKGQAGNAGRTLLSVIGFKHTNSDPLEILRGARRAALDAGNLAEAEQIGTFIAQLSATTAAA